MKKGKDSWGPADLAFLGLGLMWLGNGGSVGGAFVLIGTLGMI